MPTPIDPLLSLERGADQVVERIASTIPEPMRTPRARRFWRALLWGGASVYFLFALILLGLRYLVMPEIASYRPQIEQALSEALHRPVQIRELSAHWAGLHPGAYLRGLTIADTRGQPALQLDQVDAQLSWESFLVGELRLAKLEILAPDLSLRRDTEGKFFVAGMEITPGTGEDNSAADWLLAQDKIVIRDARLRWQDEQRHAPLLDLAGVSLQLENSGRRHRFGLISEGSEALARRIDLRGEFHGRDMNSLADWNGDVYLALDAIDLAVWQRWVDYPVELPRGHGSLRLWLGLAERSVRTVTVETDLQEVSLRLRPDLPLLDLINLSGRVAFEQSRQGMTLKTEKLSLTTHDGLHLAPSNASFRSADAAFGEQRIDGTINTLELATLARLAEHLPLPVTITERLQRFSPRGTITDLQFGWTTVPKRAGPGAPVVANETVLTRWKVNGKFTGLGLRALGPLPGIQGISGSVLGDEHSGRLTLASTQAAVELPTLFPEPSLGFDKLEAVLEWDQAEAREGGTRVMLRRASFENRDAAGTATGRWHPVAGDSAGYIDLSAQLSRANGASVWRYMPSAVGQDARDWLRSAITGGTAHGTQLTLKGRLADFPFRDPGTGTFEVRSQIQGARLIYGENWPVIENIDGDILFKGPGMLVSVRSANTLGAQLSHVRAEIADLEKPTTLLTINGQASGPTSEFLRFIEASPVGASIDHFTRQMSATGSGGLDLSLQLPLETIEKTRVDGRYRIDGNTIRLDETIPVISNVNGVLAFTENSISAAGLRGNLLGGPVSASIKTENKAIGVTLSGEASVAGLRSYPPLDGLGVLDHLSGSSKWAGNLRIGAKGVDMLVTSSLVGLSSSLPAPFNKTANETVPARFERKPVPARPPERKKSAGQADEIAGDASRRKVSPGGTAPAPVVPEETLDLTIGRQLRLQLGRRQIDGEQRIVRGVLSAGRATPGLPERDLQVSIDVPGIDLDFWRRNLTGNSAPAAAGDRKAPAAHTLLPLSFDLRTDTLKIFDRDFPGVRLTGKRIPDANGDGITRAEVRSQSFAANLEYSDRATGRLSGTIPNLAIPEITDDSDLIRQIDDPTREIIKRLPAIDLTIDHLSYKKQELGRLTLGAENRAGSWDAKLALRNADATLEGTAKWRPEQTNAKTEVDLRLDATNLENLLGRLGMPGSMRRGTGHFEGQLAWQGAPVAIDYGTLGGNFRFEAADGQFNKLEPGVGRLLGILSLQSLPRRITLDFRDIFSQGFAFDRIAGTFAVSKGIMHTSDLEVRGPAAKVVMRGQVDLDKETQDLTVRVQPALGESIAVGAMLTNPVTGAIVWAAQKLLSDPLDQVFAFDYAVSGSWSDPKVEKLAGKAPTSSPTNDSPAAGERK